MNKPELPAAVFGLLGAGALGMIFPAFSFAMSALLSIFYEPVDEIGRQIVKWSAVFVAIGFGSLIAALVESFSFNYMGQHLGNRIRLLLIRALLRQEVGWFDDEENSSGILTSKLSADALAVKGQFGDSMGLITQVRRL